MNINFPATLPGLGLSPTDSPQFTAVNLGHASDTTLARSAAGTLMIEDNISIGSPATATASNVAVVVLHSGQTNSSLRLAPKGTGAIIAGPAPDGTAAGGNARGASAVDLQLGRGAASQVASGVGAFAAGNNNTASNANTVAMGYGCMVSASQSVGIGYSCIVSGSSSFASGEGCQATAYVTQAGGLFAVANHRGERAYSGIYLAAVGDAQYSDLNLAGTTTNATITELFLDKVSARVTIAAGQAFAFRLTFIAKQRSSANAAKLVRSGLIVNNSGTTALTGSVATEGTDITGSLAVSVTVTADDTNDSLKVQVTGLAATNIDWNVHVEITSLTN